MSNKPLSIDIIEELVAKAEILRQCGKLPVAAEVLTKGIKLAHQNKRLYYALTETLFEAEQYQAALDSIEKVDSQEIDVRQAELKGFCLEKLQRYPESEQIVDQILGVTEASAPALNLKGLLFYHKKDLQRAEQYFESAIESDPEYGQACMNLGLLKLEMGDDRKALEILHTGFVLSPHVNAVANTFHEVVSALGAFAEAEPIFRDACRRYPVNKRLAYLLIDILIQQKKFRESMSAIEGCLATFGVEDGILAPALKIRAALGPRAIDPEKLTNGSISLCMIVKNEESHLAKCLESVKKAVNEIVVVDTGSTDRSADIARAYGADVYTCEWHNDFSQARNLSLSKARGQWILILDADEKIAQRDLELLSMLTSQEPAGACAFKFVTRNYTKDAGAEGWQVNDDQYPHEKAGKGWYPSQKVRLFPRDNRIVFENAVHELVEPSVRRAGISIKKCSVPIHHYGTLNRKKEAKKKAGYYTLGKEKIAGNRANPSAFVEHAIQAQEVGDYNEALNLWEAVLEHCPNLPKAYFNLSYVHIQLEQYHQGHAAALKAMELDPNLKEAVLNYALCLIRTGQIEQAAERLEIFLIEAPDHPMGKGLLAVARCITGKRDDGLRLFHEIREMGFNCPEYILDHAQKMAAADRRDEAGRLLQAIAESPFADNKIQSMLMELTRCRVESAPLQIRFLDLNDVGQQFLPHLKLLDDHRNLDQQLFRPVTNVKDADFILFPYSIDPLYHQLGHNEFCQFLKQLPFYSEYEHKFVFFLQDDIGARFNINSVIYRVNHDRRKMDTNSITMPYFIDDVYQTSLSNMPPYHVNFVGTIVTHVLRAYMLVPFLGKENIPHYQELLGKFDTVLGNRQNPKAHEAAMAEALSVVQRLFPHTRSLQEINYYLDISVDQFPRLARNVQRAKKAQLADLMAQSVATLCPRGFGVQSIRFFETLSAGRIPILISDNYRLPLENRIDYESLLCKIDESEILKLNERVADFFRLYTPNDLFQKANAARDVWLNYFSPQKLSRFIYLTLSEVLIEDYRLNKL